MGISPHVRSGCQKSKIVFSHLAGVARAKWGISTRVMEMIYRGVLLAMVTYAAAGWADRVNSYHRKQLTQAQRYALLGVTKAYRTIPTDALCVIAGATPIECVLKERRSAYYLRSGISFTHSKKHFEIQLGITKEEVIWIKKEIIEETYRTWQTKWDYSQKGRLTYQYYKDISQRMAAKWIEYSYYTAQLISGHGNLKFHLKKLALSETE